MPEMNRPSVKEAVLQFFALCDDSPAFWERLDAFIDNLSHDDRWNAEELAELRAQIVERVTA